MLKLEVASGFPARFTLDIHLESSQIQVESKWNPGANPAKNIEEKAGNNTRIKATKWPKG